MNESTHFDLELPCPLAELVHACEVHCVAGCCGADAFDVSVEHMVPWMRGQDEGAARQALPQLDFLLTLAINSLQDLSSRENDFNMRWTPADCVAYLNTWRAEMVRALALAFPPAE